MWCVPKWHRWWAVAMLDRGYCREGAPEGAPLLACPAEPSLPNHATTRPAIPCHAVPAQTRKTAAP